MAWAIEGTRHYGLGLARHLTGNGYQIAEIDAARHVGGRRAGKSDPIDAVHAARELLARPHRAQMRADSDREILRLLMPGRDNAVASVKTARTALASVLVTAPGSGARPAAPHPRRAPDPDLRPAGLPARHGPPDPHGLSDLIRLGQRVLALTELADHLETQIAAIVENMAPGLVEAEYGLGALTVAQILLSWSHARRIRTEAAFAMLSGTARPGLVRPHRRHRLNRLGDRKLNRALHTIAVSRMRNHPPTLAYMHRRRAEGKTDREIRRCIKRYLARHLYRALNRD